MEEAYRPITVVENGRSVTMPLAQAFMRSLGVSALNGQARAQKLLAELLTSAEAKGQADYARYVAALFEYKSNARKLLDWHRERGLPEPELLPHPEDIAPNLAAGTVDICGPMTREQLEIWKEFASIRDEARQEAERCETERMTTDNSIDRAVLGSLIRKLHTQAAGVADRIGEWPNHRTGVARA